MRSFLGLPGTQDKPGWQGKLVTDDFSGYTACFELGVAEVGCMAHPRHKFHELWANHQSQVGEQALQFFGQLYDVEREVANGDPQHRCDVRRRRSRPVADTLHQRLIQQRQKVPDGSGHRPQSEPVGQLSRATSTMAICPSTTTGSRTRSGRSPSGATIVSSPAACVGKRAAAIMSLVHSARLDAHQPYAYLRAVLQRLPAQQASRIDELLPHRWQPAASS